MSSIPFPQFTDAARKRWEQVPEWAKPEILDAVWCGNCLAGTPMRPRSGEMKGKYLVLHGTCSLCGKAVARVIEPEQP